MAGIPLRQFVVKLHSRCNLACDYCYVYTMDDQRWRDRPRVLSPKLAERTAARVAEHAHRHGIPEVRIVLHGGEPLLAGTAAITHFVTTVRAALGDRARAVITLQTNGTLLTEGRLRTLAALGVRVGVSLDGTPASQNRRRDHRGRGSHDLVAAGLARLRAPHLRHLYAGLLATIDLAADPVATYEALLAHQPPKVDFLLPHGNWSAPPPGRAAGAEETPYADWLIAVFDRWYRAPRRETGIRLFEEIIRGLFGGTSRMEGIGLGPLALAVVETDGSIEMSDTLASAYHGAASTGLHVDTDSFDAVLSVPAVYAQQSGAEGLPLLCRGCGVRRVCGGGLRAHRYRAGHGFDNPSVYCPDLLSLIRHIRTTLADDVAALRETAV
jgi:uncharacterized protein